MGKKAYEGEACEQLDDGERFFKVLRRLEVAEVAPRAQKWRESDEDYAKLLDVQKTRLARAVVKARVLLAELSARHDLAVSKLSAGDRFNGCWCGDSVVLMLRTESRDRFLGRPTFVSVVSIRLQLEDFGLLDQVLPSNCKVVDGGVAA